GENGEAYGVFFIVSQPYPYALQVLLIARYPKQLPSVANFGLSGQDASWASEVRRFSSVAGGSIQVMLIMEGSNDVNSRDAVVTRAAAANIRQMVQIAKSRGIRPMVATIPPMICGRQRSRGCVEVDGYNDLLRSVAAAEGVPLVDIYR